MVPRFVLEGKKIDHLVQENEGGRKLANQIVRQVFRPRGNKEEKLASGHRVSVFEAHIYYGSCSISIHLFNLFNLHFNLFPRTQI